MELSDEQLVLMTWEVALRKGWGFVVDTLLRGGVEVFSPAFGDSKDQGFWSQFGDWSEQGLIPADNPLVSQESGDEEEEEITKTDKSYLGSMEWPSWSGQCPRCSTTTLSSLEKPPVLSAKGNYQGGRSVYSKIKEFIDEVTRVFQNYFPGIEMRRDKQAMTCQPSNPLSLRAQPGLSTDTWVKRPTKDAQTQAPPWDASSVLGEQPPIDAISRASPLPQQVALVRAMPVLPSVAAAESVPPAPVEVADDFHWVKPLAAHVPMQLRETVVSLRFFDIFSLLQGQSIKHPGQKEDAIDRTLVNWQNAFEVMGSILLEDAPEKMKGFFNYSATIRRAYDSLPEGAWLIYDQLFRKLKETHPDMSWAVVHPQLWQKVSKPVQHPHGSKASEKTCQLYDEDKCELADLCQFAHLCSVCGGKHPKVKCSLHLHPKSSPRSDTAVKQHPRVECSTEHLDGKDKKPEAQKRLGKVPPGSFICRHYSTGYCRLGNDCGFKHLCYGCGGQHAWVNCGTVAPEKHNLKKKQQLDEEAVMKKKHCEHQQGELVTGGFFSFGDICAKSGGKPPTAESTIVKPGLEAPQQENQKNSSGGPVVKGYCSFYNRGGCSLGRTCRYNHVCSGCGDSHPLIKCSKVNPTSVEWNPKKRRRGRKKHKQMEICQMYNIEKCKFGNLCLLKHVCSECLRPHPVVTCGSLINI
ncbi:uncharacterized protein [Pleurodeles waltl]|uniref:uncharacterized protein n=1 Tax=Pleurodeles waltl TaxID=8319 RepID=UPI003709A751